MTTPPDRPPGSAGDGEGADAVDALGTLPQGRRLSPQQRLVLRRFAVRAYRDGDSVRTIAARTRRSYSFIHGLLTEAGVPLRGRGGDVRAPADPPTDLTDAPTPAGSSSTAQAPGADRARRWAGPRPDTAAGLVREEGYVGLTGHDNGV